MNINKEKIGVIQKVIDKVDDHVEYRLSLVFITLRVIMNTKIVKA